MMTSETTPAPSPETRIPVDRIHVFVKALWRLLIAAALLGLAWLLGVLIGDWSLFWREQPVTLLAILLFLAGLSIIGAVVAFGGSRWLALACWPAPVGVQIGAGAIDAALGPFGSVMIPWTRLRCEVAEGFDIEMLSHVGDDAFTPVMRDALDPQRDVYAWLQAHTGADPETLTHTLRPHFEARMRSA
ncbi:MAG: hypothetical protein KDA33_06055 [Phycisphaerales bacterium]|nr:hypothetical protein [Phycisphaerales bacterium]